MNSSKGPRASDASDRPESVALNLQTVRKMLPLVRHIVEEILALQEALKQLHPRQARLEEFKRGLSWPDRQLRYQLQQEIAEHEKSLGQAREELQNLGVVMLDVDHGRVGFPTTVNNRAAYFSWNPSEDQIKSWHFAEETACRPIPSSWLHEPSLLR